jgi:hypothetical protein
MGELKNTTAIVKTFERPDCLHSLVESLRRSWPTLPLVIVDDSRIPYAQQYKDPHTWIMILPNDSGIGLGRNAALAACRTPSISVSWTTTTYLTLAPASTRSSNCSIATTWTSWAER